MSNDRLDRAIKAAMDGVRVPDTAKAALDNAFASIAQDAGATTIAAGTATAGATSSATATSPVPAPNTGRPRRSRPAFPFPTWARVTAMACAVCVGLGGTAYAADKLGLIHIQWPGAHSAEVAVNLPAPAEEEETSQYVDEYRVLFTPPDIAFEKTETTDDLCNYFVDYYNIGENGDQYLCLEAFFLDKDAALAELYVTDAETVQVNGREAALLQRQTPSRAPSYTLYLPFIDEQRMVTLSSSGIDREKLLDCAASISLEKTGRKADIYDFWTWSNRVDVSNSTAKDDVYHSEYDSITLDDAEMANMHQIGETFVTQQLAEESGDATISAKVVDVEIADNLNGLSDQARIPSAWKKVSNPDGTLGTDTITFTKMGDGIETIDQEVATEESDLALVTATVQYTNTGETTIKDCIYMGALLSVTHENGQWKRYNRAEKYSDADIATNSKHIGTGEMVYYLSSGKGSDNPDNPNHILDFKPGETVEVTMAWLVNKDEMDKLILSLDPSGYEFDLHKEDASIGYVDLRQ